MSLFLLKRTDRVGYDENDACVVRASSEAEARQVAAGELHGDEGSATWAESGNITITKLEPRGPAELVLASFNAG